MRGLSLVAASRDHSSSRCAGLSLSWRLLLRSTGSRRAGSVVVAHGPSCSTSLYFLKSFFPTSSFLPVCDHIVKTILRDFPGGPVVETLPSNAGGVGSIPGRGLNLD